jgi:hypothetical protein
MKTIQHQLNQDSFTLVLENSQVARNNFVLQLRTIRDVNTVSMVRHNDYSALQAIL